MDAVQWFNLCEAVLWLVIAVALAVQTKAGKLLMRRLCQILALAFFLFSISDVIEIQTGAWWKPIWLMLLKGSCIATFAWGLWRYRQLKSSAGDESKL